MCNLFISRSQLPVNAPIIDLSDSWPCWSEVKSLLSHMVWKALYSVWPGRRKKKSHVSVSKAVLFAATKQVCVSWTLAFPAGQENRNKWLSKEWQRKTEGGVEEGVGGTTKAPILPKSSSLDAERRCEGVSCCWRERERARQLEVAKRGLCRAGARPDLGALTHII